MSEIIIKTSSIRNWSHKDDIYCTGYVMDYHNHYYQGEEFISLIRNGLRKNSLKFFLKDLRGNFAIILEREDEIIAATDQIGSIHLFYYYKNNDFILTDDIHSIHNLTGYIINTERLKELRTAGYVLGKETLNPSISRVNSDEVIHFKKSEGKVFFDKIYELANLINTQRTEEDLYQDFHHVTEVVFNRLIKSLNNKPVVIPLSGGYDSRFIACKLKELGVDNVMCFTYGHADYPEVAESRKVAHALGFKWEYVEYSRELWENVLHDPITADYFKFAGQCFTLPHIQDFPAVSVLREKGLLPDNCIFIPGHTGDLLAGKRIPVEMIENETHSLNHRFFIRTLLRQHFNFGYTRKIVRKKLINTIEELQYLPDANDFEEYVYRFGYWDYKERQNKYIVNSLRVYDFFGYDWRIPLWDQDFISFWFAVSYKYRKNRSLYESYLNTELFKRYGLEKSSKTYKEINHTQYMLRSYARIVKDFFSAAGFIKRTSLLKELESLLYDDLTGFKRIKYDNLFSAMTHYYFKKVISKL